MFSAELQALNTMDLVWIRGISSLKAEHAGRGCQTIISLNKLFLNKPHPDHRIIEDRL